MHCGRCFDGFILNIYGGTCHNIEEYQNLSTSYLKMCSKIVSENPWRQKIKDAENFLCQKCNLAQNYPSLLGKCVDSQAGCKQFFEALIMQDTLMANYTEALLYQPFDLIAVMSPEAFNVISTRCLSCILPTDIMILHSTFVVALKQALKLLRMPNARFAKVAPPPLLVKTLYCSQCKQCVDLSTTILNNESEILGSDYTSYYFGKRIYSILISNGANLPIIPPLNDSFAFASLYKSLNEQKSTNYAINQNLLCVICPINALNCKIPSSFDPTLWTDVEFKNVYPLIGYFAHSLNCKPGFVYDYNFRRCKFCPNNWTACETYKELKIILRSQKVEESSNAEFQVTSIQEMFILIEFVGNGEFAYMMNEFMVTKINIVIELETKGNLLLKMEDRNFSLQLINNFKTKDFITERIDGSYTTPEW